MPQKMRLLLAMMLAVALVVAACGGGGSSTPTATPEPAVTEEAEVTEAEAAEGEEAEVTEAEAAEGEEAEVTEAEAAEGEEAEVTEAEAAEGEEVEATEPEAAEGEEVEATEPEAAEGEEVEATEPEAAEGEEVAATEGEEAVTGLITSVCLVTDQGGIDDGNFNALANNGMERASSDFGLQTTVIESTVAADYAPNIQSCLDSGANVIVTVGFLVQEASLSAATANPDVYFIAVDQFFEGHPANLVGTVFREDQAGFLVGAMAALVSESNIIGGVYGIDVPAVVKFRNGFEQGARYINPDIVVLGQYTDSFVDAPLGATIAEQLIADGADVIFGAGGATGTGAIQFAAAEGVKAIGVDQDEYYTNFGAGESPGAENLITSALKGVDVAVYDMIAGLVNAEGYTFIGGGNYLLEASNDGIGFAPAHDADVAQEVIDQVVAVYELLKSGELETGIDPISGALIGAEVEAEAAEGEEAEAEEATETEEVEATETEEAEVEAEAQTAETGDFTALLAAVEAAGLTETLATGGPYTIFAPTDAAFAALEEAPEGDALQAVLLNHVVEGELASADIEDGATVTTLGGLELTFAVTEAGVTVNGANVVLADAGAANGIIHAIDAVLVAVEAEEAEAVETEEVVEAEEEEVEVPSSAEQISGAIARLYGAARSEEAEATETEATDVEEGEVALPSIVDVVLSDGRFNTIIELALVSGMAETLAGDAEFTVFLPTDEAFGLLPEGVLAGLTSSPISVQSVLGAHLVAGRFTAEDVFALEEAVLETQLTGASIAFAEEDGVIVLNGGEARVVDVIEASNGIVYVVDAVLLESAMNVAAQMGAPVGEAEEAGE